MINVFLRKDKRQKQKDHWICPIQIWNQSPQTWTIKNKHSSSTLELKLTVNSKLGTRFSLRKMWLGLWWLCTFLFLNKDPRKVKGNTILQTWLYFCEVIWEVPLLTAAEAVTWLVAQAVLQRKKLTLALKILLSSLVLMALNVSPERNINIIGYVLG